MAQQTRDWRSRDFNLENWVWRDPRVILEDRSLAAVQGLLTLTHWAL